MKWIAILGAVVVVLGAGFYLRSQEKPAVEEQSPRLAAEHEARALTVTFWQHYRSAMKLRRIGKWDEAIAEFANALEIDPQHEDSLYYLGNAYFESAAYEKAADCWRRLLDANPMASRAHVQIGLLKSCPDVWQMFDLQEARDSLERAFALNPEQSGPLSLLGEVELALDNRARAAELFEDARRQNPRAVSAFYLGAYLALKDSDRTVATSLLSGARSAVPASRVTNLPTLEGDIRPGDQDDRVEETMSSRRLFAPLLQRLQGDDELDVDVEAAAVEAYLAELPNSGQG